ncbi:MAG: UDP-N-acetylmuramoyl-L-alanyl-D-glutamate--2,6-diaminopimelate ligase [Dehalococcoidia bacterium]
MPGFSSLSSQAPGARTWLQELRQARVVSGEAAAVSAVCYDSRRVVPGALFVAVPGFEADGHDFIPEALERGAVAVLLQEDRRDRWEPYVASSRATLVAVPDTRAALATVAAAFYGHPARRLGVIGVTGTDGKTTTIHLIATMLEAAGRPTGYLSSVEFRAGGEARLNASHMTTLEASEVQELLARMVAAGDRYAVIEASSHGLALHRVDECQVDVAVFTNLSRDHLDFHGTLEEYRQAKGRLFQMLDESVQKGVPKAAVLNADDPASGELKSLTETAVLTYGVQLDADIKASQISCRSEGLSFEAEGLGGRFSAKVKLLGCHNVYNCLAAAAVGYSQGLSPEEIRAGLEKFEGVAGRMERMDEGQEFDVVVDIASTPKALRNVLDVLRPVTVGRLWVVFGCAGERDVARRDGMGRVAGESADFAVLTNEDPRSEDPDAIIEAIAGGLRETGRTAGKDFVRVLDRRQAIAYALQRARPGDVVLLAGKGSEQSIVVGREHIPWDERVVAREVLREVTGSKASERGRGRE